ncbi:MAG TPA: RNA methyltransferase [Candidatus Binataceae bacterium]|nr:RNA methyltransferase [Candidatus Binataceae bacterium]
MTLRERTAFVLYKPQQAGNIGSVARALKNMGVADLRIVAPEAPPNSRAAATMAVHARDLLARAAIHPDLAGAIADRTITVGTTCRAGGYRGHAAPLRESVRELAALGTDNRIAIVFGPEDRGLTNRELKLCNRLITIPTAPEYPSLNLAQAVMIVAYELMLAGSDSAAARRAAPRFADAAAAEAALDRLAEALVAIGFLPADNPEHIMLAIRAIFGRSGLTAREVEIVNGIARQARWAAEGGAATLMAKRAAGRKLK